MHAYEICMVSYARKLISEHGVSEFGHMACPNSDFFFFFFFFFFFSFFLFFFFLRVSQMSFLKLRVTRATRAFYTGEKSASKNNWYNILIHYKNKLWHWHELCIVIQTAPCIYSFHSRNYTMKCQITIGFTLYFICRPVDLTSPAMSLYFYFMTR